MEKGSWDSLTDICLVNNVKNVNCEKSLQELIKRHSGLCFKIMSRFSKSFYANNIDLDSEAGFDTASVGDDILDFTERNPFGEVDF